MKEDIRKKLEHTYEALVHVALYNHPLSEIEPHIDKGLMGYGSALDETVFGWKEFKWMIERQREEMGEGELTIKRIPVFQESFSNDHSALIVEEFEFTINAGEETHGFTLRLSTLLEYQKDQWMIKHFHGSTADADTPEGNAWPIEEWKRRNAELQRVVAEKTSDLQKKNKDLEIEAALERIRSRALAMQKSEEISDVVWSVMQNMSTLDIEMNGGVSLATFISGSKDLIHWYVNPDHPESPKSMRLPYFKNLVFDEFNEAREKGEPWLARVYSFEEKNDYFNYAFEHSDFKYVPDELKNWILEQPTFGYTVVIENHCCIFLNDYTGKLFTEEENKIFKRFSLVFEQAYTRFLDLQKAEEQAREAQIETALEKVRARTMAMHSSEELLDIIIVVAEQLEKLHIEFGNVSFGVNNQDYDLKLWMAVKGDDKAYQVNWSFIDNPGVTRLREAQHQPEQVFSDVLDQTENNEWMQHVFECNPSLDIFSEKNKKRLLKTPGYARSIIVMKDIFLVMGNYTLTPYTDKENSIFKKIAKVFEQAYTRFLDLQKAEAQAKEAQIEAALERVRSRSMAMHKSSEMLEVADVLFQQLRSLGGNLWGCGVLICQKDADDDEVWFANENGVLPPVLLPHTEDPTHKKMYEGWLNELELYSEFKEGQELKNHYDYMLSEPAVKPLFEEILASGLTFPTWQKWHAAYFSQGYLLIITVEHYEDEKILTRFAKVFDQAYTRFLDLQKAEAQAREAQIEAALERVRSSAMAMHKTDELKGVIRTIFDQLALFDIDAEHAGIVVDFEEKQDWNFWIAETQDIPSRISVPYLDSLWDRQFTEAKKKGDEFFTTQMNFEEKNKFYDKLLDHIPELSKEARDFYFDCPGLAISTVVQDDIGLYIENFSGIPYSNEDNNILIRFGKVFQQAYTRFLDLKNAEEQAREARIEAALERVRSRSMAMHKSEELADLSLELVKQVQELGVATWFCAFNIYDDDPRGSLEWGSNGQGTFPQYRTPREGIFLKYYEAGQRGETLLVHEIGEDECPAHYEYLCSLPGVGDQLLQMKAEGIPFPTSQIDHVAFFKYGYLLFISYDPVPETHDIFVRFAKVFEQTYTRFLDLQKAEAQAREAQIEAAMERVRSRAMAMQKAEELVDVAALLRKEMGRLGVEELETSSIYIHDEISGKTECWFSIQDQEQEDKLISDHMTMDLNDSWVGRQMLEFYASDGEQCSIVMKGKHRTEWINYCADQSDLFSAAEFYGERIPERTYHLYRFSDGYMGAAAPGDISEESWNLLRRATAVFSLAYTRFRDLQTAEAQAREAQIELALERARNQSMLMQHSEELNKVSNVFHEQLLELGIPTEFSYVWLPNEEDQTHMFWATWSQTKKDKLTSHTKAITNPLDKTEPYTAACYEMWESNQSVFVNPIPPEDVKEFFTEWEELLSEADHMKAELFPDGLYYAEAYMKYGCFGINIRRSLTEEEQQVMQRFSIEFERAYTRFLDLKKAEEQAREAQIEVALEKVRSRTMAMQSSDELPEAANLLFLEVQALGIPSWSAGYNILSEDKTTATCWMSSEGTIQPPFTLHYQGEKSFEEQYDFFLSNENFFIQELSGKALKMHYDFMKSIPKIGELIAGIEQSGISLPTYQINHFCKFEQGYLLFITYEPVQEAHEIFRRFTSVFEQTYTRFLDLQKAEAQAREAQIELSLERIRAQVTGMQESSELLDIMVAMRKEFVELGHDAHYFWHMRWLPETYQKAMTSGDGTRIGMVMELPRKIHGEIPLLANWEKGDKPTVVYPMDVEATLDYIHKMVEWGDFKQVDPNMPSEEDIHHIGGLTYVMARTQHGEIGYSLPGIVPEPPEEDINTLVRFADAFDLAYRRFEDLQKSEKQARLIKEEKERLEVTLEDLKAAQAQLVQSEKMASLGELTAGIAHEIQNPLNFVNNFSDISGELLDEVLEELNEGNIDDVREIISDLKQNLEKINHHGGRADSIVKGMLQHSRTSTGEKEPTDINELADEYLRLAYHGLRAKDPTFNAVMETNFDDSIGKVNVIPQDMGRVLLNLITNAFQALSTEALAKEGSNYQPKVTLTTQRLFGHHNLGEGDNNSTIQLSISDNGPGIPDSIKDKIFQPFFTTKPTGEGTGLGLSLAYDIIKAHGGELKVKSEIGRGTEFIIELPNQG